MTSALKQTNLPAVVQYIPERISLETFQGFVQGRQVALDIETEGRGVTGLHRARRRLKKALKVMYEVWAHDKAHYPRGYFSYDLGPDEEILGKVRHVLTKDERIARATYKKSLTVAKKLQAAHKKAIRLIKKTPDALYPHLSDIGTVQIGACEADHIKVYVFPEENLPDGWLPTLFAESTRVLIHNAKFEAKFLYAKYGYMIPMDRVEDTMLAEYAILGGGQSRGNLSYDTITGKYCHLVSPLDKDPEVRISDWKSRRPLDARQIEYAGGDVNWIHTNWESQADLLDDRTKYLYDLEKRLVPFYARLELDGMAINRQLLFSYAERYGQEMAEAAEAVFESFRNAEFPANDWLDIDSSKSLKEALHKIGVPVENTSKKGRKAHKHATLDAIDEYKPLYKLMKAFIGPLLDRSQHDGLVYPSINSIFTATSRMSCNDPNLQQQPTEDGFRDIYVPKRGLFTVGDLSQIEMRILAQLSDEYALIKAFNDDQDVHTMAACLIYSLDYKEAQAYIDLTDDEVSALKGDHKDKYKFYKGKRKDVKAVQFGIVYGKTAFGLSQDLGVDFSAAQRLIDSYFTRLPRVRKYIRDTQERARRDGYIENLAGFRRALPGINSEDRKERAKAEREAVNTDIQSLAAIGMKEACAYYESTSKDYLGDSDTNACPCIVVHDELVVDHTELVAGAVRGLVGDSLRRGNELYITRVPVRVGSAATKWQPVTVPTWGRAK